MYSEANALSLSLSLSLSLFLFQMPLIYALPFNQAMEQEVDTQRNMIKHLEKRLKISDLENQEKLSRMRLTYEERLKGMISIVPDETYLRGET